MSENDIAIVGLATHLPRAADQYQLWSNLVGGVESVRPLTDEELLAAGVSKEAMSRPGYVKAAAPLEDVYGFDAEFFGFSPKEAGIMDPQHRHFLMAAWEALEDAGHVPEAFDGAVGVFAGCGVASYYMFNLLTNRDLVDDVGLFLLRHTGNDKDFLATRASYLFDLRGPSVNVQTACSTSLVATHLAVQSLLSGECDLALAGGVTIEIPHGQGYQYHEGEVLSPDGHCRAFDHKAQGTVFGSGVGVVALRRLDDALADRDQIYAVIKGSAVNNDGTLKVGYLAPSVDGQAACIAEALAVADVEPETISYVECHGTGTQMGDPIELAALRQAFGRSEDGKAGYCRIGSIKTNIGHLDTAAGVASLIKVSLALRHGLLPPTLNFEAENPQLELPGSPFVVNDELTEWRREGSQPRRAGVNSLGVGGTNAFVVVEEAPPHATPVREAPPEGPRIVTLSARNQRALNDAAQRLARHLREHPEVDIDDAVWTLQVGRQPFSERMVLGARDRDEAIALLEANDRQRVFTHTAGSGRPAFAFMFPGGGTQHPRMMTGLYHRHPVFAQHLDAGLDLLRDEHDIDLRPLLLGDIEDLEAAAHELEAPHLQLPAIFVTEYALAQLLISWGIEPDALIGHSVGENTAACVAGTISFRDCVGLVALRGRLTGEMGGGVTAVPLPVEEVRPLLEEIDLDLAVVNTPELCVVSGPEERLAVLEARLTEMGVEGQRVKVSAAAHSRLFDPILDDLRSYLEGVTLSPPQIRWVSNLTGTWITDEQATSPQYWADHLRHTVLFADGIATLAENPDRVLLEVGAGKTLSSLARMHPDLKSSQASIATMRHPDQDVDDDVMLATTLGRIWAVGGPLGLTHVTPAADPRRVALPTYPFQTQPFFIEPGGDFAGSQDSGGSPLLLDRETDEDRWQWEPVWRSRDADEPVDDEDLTWLVLADPVGVADELVPRLRQRGHQVVLVRPGDAFHAVSDDEFRIAPEDGLPGYEALLKELVRTGRTPDRIAHLGLLARDEREFRMGSSFFHRNQELGFQSLLFLAQAWTAAEIQRPVHFVVATAGAQVARPGDRAPWFEQSTVLGPAQVIPREVAGATVTTFDVDPADLGPERAAIVAVERIRARLDGSSAERPDRKQVLLDTVERELLAPAADAVVAIRGDRRYVRELRRVPVGELEGDAPLRRGAVVLVTGGVGGVGFTMAEHLFEAHGARLALLSRTPLPDRATWDELVDRLGPRHATSIRIQRVRDLEERGAEVMLVDGDVTDTDRIAEVVAAVRARFGSIDAVIHAAGVVDDALLSTKDLSDIEEVLAPKVYGTIVLEEATRSDDLDLFLVVSSTSTWTAPVGQVDYVAANAFLNAFAASRQADGATHVRAVDWGVWAEVGMAAEAQADRAPAEEPEWAAANSPLFTERSVDATGTVRIRATWSATDDWWLDHHRTAAGVALLPGSGYPELARAALAEIGVDQPFEIEDLTFLRPLVAADDRPTEVEVLLSPTASGYSLAVRQRVAVPSASSEGAPAEGRKGWQRTGEAQLRLRALPATPSRDLAAAEAACPTRAATRTRQQDHLRFGPRWDVVERVQTGPASAVAWLALDPAFEADVDDVGLHPALFDLATGFPMDLIEGYDGSRLWVPVSYQSIRVHGRLPARVVAAARVRAGASAERGFATFDVDICAPDGSVLVDVTGFTIKATEAFLELSPETIPSPGDVELDEVAASARPLSPSEAALQHTTSQGIRVDEGKRALERVLRSGRPVVYVSSIDLRDLKAQADRLAASELKGASTESSAVFARPALASEFVAPRNATEETLVAMWQELLGINEIGVQDSFFDLGGHSLIAVRLFARVRRVFGVDFPISILFEAPTVEACARLINEALPASDEATGGEEPSEAGTVQTPQPRFKHLVAMHPGEAGPRTPFFLVAGMFGNVLNLRHLAHLIGTDRPFYGIQAKGLFGGEEPHDDFTDMASAYLEELRQVQPHGPYLLGGFSGGGITAYEMAQQLRAEGEETRLLVFLDTLPPKSEPITAKERLLIQADRLKEKGPRYVKEWAVNRWRWELERRHRAAHGPEVPTDEGALHSSVIEAAFYRALDKYEVAPYPGTIHLYRPKLKPAHILGEGRMVDEDRRLMYPDNGWGRYAERIEITEVPGDHDRMVLEPSVRVLATHLRAALDEAEAGTPAGA